MASLYEIGKEYEKSAELLRQRLKELRELLDLEEDAETRWKLKRRIKELSPLLTECNKTAEHCTRYYEQGYYISDGYFGIGRRERLAGSESQTLQGVTVNFRKRANTITKRDIDRMSDEREKLFGLCRRKGSKQINSIQNLLQGCE